MMDEHDLLRHLQEGGSDLWERPEPPPLDLAAITGASHAAVPAQTKPAWRRWLTPRPITLAPLGFAAGALACVAIGLGGGFLAFGGSGSPTPVARTPVAAPPTEQFTMRRLGDAPAGATAVVSVFSRSDGKSVSVRVAGLPRLQHGTFYEFWALGKRGRMVSLGTLSVDSAGRGAASMRIPVSLNRFPVLDLSLERADGNPAHSGHSLLRAPV